MAAQPVTDVIQRLVIIRINPAVRQVVLIRQVLVPVGLTQSLTGAAALALNVLHAATHLLPTGVQSIQHVMAIAAKTEQ